MAIHIFLELNCSANLYLEMVSWGFSVLEFKFLGRVLPVLELLLTLRVTLEQSWSGAGDILRWGAECCAKTAHRFIIKFVSIVKLCWGPKSRWLYFCGNLTCPAEAFLICSRAPDISSEAETRTQTRRTHAIVTQRLVLVAGSSPVPPASDGHERCRKISEQVFDNGVFCFKWG